MSKKSIFELVFSVSFIGIILSFTLFFLLNLSLRPEYNIVDEYFDGKEIERTEFSAFDDACLKNRHFHDQIIESEYRIFGNIFGENVIKGSNGFLFMGGENDLGYDFIADYTGELSLESDALEQIYQYIEMRSKAYENRGIKYYIAVLPNSQTVYSEYMPTIYGELSDRTALKQVQSYLEGKSFDSFINLSDAMIDAKSNGLLYNNTENSINALGAYYAYEEIMNFIASDVEELAGRVMERDFYSLYTHYTDGKNAAELAGIASVLQNETISMSNATEYMYTTVEIFEDLETTYTKQEYRESIPLKPSVLLEVTSEWDKIQLKPYFSNTFGIVSYRSSHTFSEAALDNSNPSIVVQLLHEDELLSVIDPSVSMSYSDGLAPGQDPYKTMKPRSVSYTLTDEKTVCITGIAESGSSIRLFGDEFESYSISETGGRFIALIRFEDTAVGKEIFINAKVEEKTVSDPVSIIITSEDTVGPGNCDVLVGINSMIYMSNYNITAIPDPTMLDLLLKNLQAERSNISALAGNDTKAIYVLIPEKLSVYSAGAPEELTDQISDMETVRSLISLRLSDAGFDTINMSPILRSLVKDTKLFMQTNENMTDAAYYYTYFEIAKMLAKDFPAVIPTDISELPTYTYKLSGGAHAEALGFDKYSFVEEAESLIVSADTNYTQAGAVTGSIDKTKAYVSHKDGEGLPTAVIVRGNVGIKILDLLSEHFSAMYVLEEHNTEIPDLLLASVKPDYVIYLIEEENISLVMKGVSPNEAD